MGTWTTETRCAAQPGAILDLLTEPEAISRWSPVAFELVGARGRRLSGGDHVRVCGSLGGCSVEFLVDVAQARDGRLALTASGPIEIDVEYVARPVADGSDLRASVTVNGRGLLGRVLAKATDALLAAGALTTAVARITQELEAPALA